MSRSQKSYGKDSLQPTSLLIELDVRRGLAVASVVERLASTSSLGTRSCQRRMRDPSEEERSWPTVFTRFDELCRVTESCYRAVDKADDSGVEISRFAFPVKSSLIECALRENPENLRSWVRFRKI